MAQGGKPPNNLEKVLDEVASAGDGPDVSVSQMMSAVGRRSFGPLILVISLIALTPLGGVPGIPTLLAVAAILIAGQLVIGLEHFWLPDLVLRRSLNRERLRTAIGYMKPVARVIDRVLRERLTWVFRPAFVRFAAVLCIIVALTVPPLEVVPFAGTVPWAAIGIFALSLIARDGALALIALAFAVGGGGALAVLLL